jgi:hypothetical protein
MANIRGEIHATKHAAVSTSVPAAFGAVAPSAGSRRLATNDRSKPVAAEHLDGVIQLLRRGAARLAWRGNRWRSCQ